jgi:hypothetical protein
VASHLHQRCYLSPGSRPPVPAHVGPGRHRRSHQTVQRRETGSDETHERTTLGFVGYGWSGQKVASLARDSACA